MLLTHILSYSDIPKTMRAVRKTKREKGFEMVNIDVPTIGEVCTRDVFDIDT